ncbi:MAG: PfkB family carbohydrate kinase [Terracidiphilus sp.]|jgi:sugar/nucleoside kinase (ribokinase family)
MHKPRVLFVGRTTLDLLYRLDRMPEEDTKTYARDLRASPGGPALNAAITHALLGGRAMLISAVGGGPWAAPVRSQLRRRGVRLLDLARGTAYETPLCTVLANAANAARTIVNPPISHIPLRHLGASWAAEMPSSWGRIPSVVLTDGFFLEETSALVAACKNEGAAICLDGGSWKPGTEELAPLLTAAICSERFAIPGHSGGPNGNSDAVFAWFAAQGVPYVAVTRGARSVLASDRGRRFEIEVAKVAATDTLGAGDVLHGAFCHYFAHRPDFEPALRRASEIATLSCQGLGAQAWATRAGSISTG